eukprot:5122-Heterococcus_DN1.PRE.1
MLDLRTVLRVDKRDAAAAEAAETSRGVLCHGELSLDHLHRARAAQSKKESSHSQLAGMYPTPAQWGSCSDSGTSSSSVVLHFEDAYSLWSFNVETCQADARLLGHLGTVNQGSEVVLVSYCCEASDSNNC